MGYYFRKTSINYNNLFQNGTGHIDYMQRWQHPGDEKRTTVPAMDYPDNIAEDSYYTYSNQLVQPADHMRLQQIDVSYFPDLKKLKFKWLPFTSICINAGVTNIGILWRSNNFNIDPDASNGFPTSRTYIIGIKTMF